MEDQLLESIPDSIIDLYMQWLYTGAISVHPTIEHADRYLLLLYATLLAGEELKDDLFLRTLWREILEDDTIVMFGLSYQSITCLYRALAEDSKARKFWVDLYTSQANPPELNSDYPQQFILDVAKALLS